MIKPGLNIVKFKADTDSFFNGGTYNTLSLDYDPLVTGYSFFKWIKIPDWMNRKFGGKFQDLTEKNFISGFSVGDMELQTTEITHGFAGNQYNIATTMNKGNNDEFSITHREFSGSPIREMYQYWVSGIRDPETGIATYPKVWDIEYSAANHTGEIVYIVTRPDANNVGKDNIEFSCYYTAVIPTRIVLSHFSYTQGTHEAVDYEQNFRGVFHMSGAVDKFAKSVLESKVYGITELDLFDPLDFNTKIEEVTGAKETIPMFNEKMTK